MAVKKGGLGRGLESLFADTGGGVAADSPDVGALPLRDVFDAADAGDVGAGRELGLRERRGADHNGKGRGAGDK